MVKFIWKKWLHSSAIYWCEQIFARNELHNRTVVLISQFQRLHGPFDSELWRYSKKEHCGREHTGERNSYSILWVCQPADAVPAPQCCWLWPSLGVWESVNTSWRVHLTVNTVHRQSGNIQVSPPVERLVTVPHALPPICSVSVLS